MTRSSFFAFQAEARVSLLIFWTESKKRISKHFWHLLGVSLLLTGCGGGGNSSAPPPGGGVVAPIPVSGFELSTASLAPGVKLLTTTEEAAIIDSTPTQITFVGTFPVVPGTVYLGNTTVFTAISFEILGGNTIVTTEEPELEALFTSLRIKGNIEASQGDFTIETPTTGPSVSPSIARSELSGEGYVSEVKVEEKGFSAVGTLTGSLSTSIDYDFDAKNGGLRSAFLQVKSENTLTTSINAKLNSSGATPNIPLGRVRVDIPLSIVDSLLRVVGVRFVSIVVPVSAGGFFDTKFDLSVIGTSTATGIATVNYTKENGPSSSFDYSGGSEISSENPTTPNGAEPFATFSSSFGPSLKIKPALLFLNKIGLVGVDLNFKLGGNFMLQAPVPDPPNYCLTNFLSTDLEAFGFFKTVGVSVLKTDVLSKNLFTGQPKYSTACRTAVVSEIIGTTPSSPSYGRSTAIKVRLSADPRALTLPKTSPSGNVQIKVGANMCNASLTTETSSISTGECSLTILEAGASTPVTVTYDGDLFYSPVVTVVSISVARASTFVGMSSSPNPSLPGSAVSLSAAITPLPLVEGSPSGTIEFRTDGGVFICSAVLSSSGTGQCSTLLLNQSGTTKIVATYSGDKNFSGSSSIGYTHSVGLGLSGNVSISGPASLPVQACPGTMSVVGTSALSNDLSSLVLTINEIISLTCYSQSTPGIITIPLVQNGDVLTGSFSFDFTCDAPCISGTSAYGVDMRLIRDNNKLSAVGTLTHTNVNQTPFSGSSSGSITLQ